MNNKQTGLGLVELMLAMVIGLFILMGLYTNLLSSQQSFSLSRSNVSLTGATSRVSQLLQNYILQAGYINYLGILNKNTFPAVNNWSSSQVIRGENDVADNSQIKSGSDSLSVRYFGSSKEDHVPRGSAGDVSADSRMLDCAGGAVSNQQLIELSLYVDSQNQLVCEDNNDNRVVIQSEVEALEFRYKTSDAQAGYRNASQLDAGDWLDIRAVEYGILLSENSGQGQSGQAREIKLLDKTIVTARDNNLRQFSSGTIMVRN